MKKHIQLLTLSLLVVAAAVYTACRKENAEPMDAVGEQEKGAFSKDLIVFDKAGTGKISLSVSSDYQEIVDLYTEDVVQATFFNEPTTDESPEDADLTTSEPGFDEASFSDYKKVFIRVNSVSSQNLFTSYNLAFDSPLRAKLQMLKVSVVVIFSGDSQAADRTNWPLGTNPKSIRMVGDGDAQYSYVRVYRNIDNQYREGYLKYCLTSKITNWPGVASCDATTQYLRKVVVYSGDNLSCIKPYAGCNANCNAYNCN